MGAPTKYKPEYCQALIEASKKGDTIIMFASSIDVHIDTLYEWKKHYPDFSEAMKLARQNAHAWFQKLGRSGMAGMTRNFNATAWTFWMRCQFSWNDFGNQEEEDSQLNIQTLD